ncbi:MAG: glycosyltransferase [Candidatus Microthrix sp.]|nr:glycosyltransferase [Candidatus Microthrix sp.]
MDLLAVSVVMPAYNEAVNLPVVLSELRDVLDGLQLPWEIVVVDDGSTDATRTVLDRLETEVPGYARCAWLQPGKVGGSRRRAGTGGW